MIGGQPIFFAPPGQLQPAPMQAPQGPPSFQPYNPPAPVNQVPPRRPVAQAPAAPVFRGSRPEEPPAPRPAPAPVSIPAPEQLGVSPAGKRDQLEWAAMPKRLRELGAVSCQVEQLPDGQWRFSCQLATTEFGRTYAIEARAETEAEAVRQVLEKAELWKHRS
jgi:hypothetical protein